jgi:predicted DNA-binding protein
MEVQFPPEVEKKLAELSASTGRDPGDLVQELVAGYFEELAHVRETLDSRYDDLKSGGAAAIAGADARGRLRDMSRRRRTGIT